MPGQDSFLDPVDSTTRFTRGARSPRNGTTTVLDAQAPQPPGARRFEDLDLSRAFGRYRVVRQLGRGGAGIVYEARSPRGRAVAIKLLVNKDPEALERFRREQAFLGQLVDRRGFVSIIDAGACSAGPFLVLELMEGGSLKERLTGEPMAISEVVRLGRTLARALGQAHALGIIHRDIKPANILYDRRARPTIADLGIGKHFRRARDPRLESVSLTAVGQAMGTPAYMAPEQLGDSRSVGPAADVYALGAVLYECLTGRPLYRGSNAAEVLLKCVQGRWMPIEKARPDCPPWLARVVERCLSRAPEARFANGRSLDRALTARRDPGPGRLWSLAYIGAAALVVFFTCALLLSKRPEGREPSPAVRVEAEGLERRLVVLDTPSNARGKHRGVLVDLALHPDGRSVFAAGLDGIIRRWRMADGHEMAAIDSGLARLDRIALTEDGGHLLAGGRSRGRQDNCLRAWDLATGQALFETTEPGEARRVVFACDGARRFAVLGSRIVRVDSAGCTPVAIPEEDPGPLSAAAAIPERDALLLCDQVGGLRLIDLTSGRVVGRGRVPSRGVLQALIVDEGRGVLLCERSGFLSEWRIEPFEELRRTRVVRSQDDRFDGALRSLALSPDGRRLFCAGDDFTIRVLDRADLRLLSVFARLDSWTARLGFTLDGRGLVSVGGDGAARVWDLRTGRERWRPTGHAGAVRAIASDPLRRRFASAGADRSLRLWDGESGQESWRRPVGLGRVAALAFSPDGRRVAAAGRIDRGGRALGGVQVWAVDGAELMAARVVAPAPALAVAFDPESGQLLVGDAGGGVVFTKASGEARRRVGHGAPVGAFAQAAGGGWRSFGLDGRAARWRGGALAARARDGLGPRGVFVLAGTGSAVVVGAGRGVFARALTDQGPREDRPFGHPVGAPLAGAMSPDGALCAVSWEQGGLTLWSTADGRELDFLEPRRPRERITALAFDASAAVLIIGTERGQILRLAVRAEAGSAVVRPAGSR